MERQIPAPPQNFRATPSRRLPANLGGWTVGVLVQTNYGGVLTVDGVRVGEALGQYYLRDETQRRSGDGSVIVVIATDAPLSDRNLERLARRAFLALGRTGSPMTNGSGDYAIAFSTNMDVRRTPDRRAKPGAIADLPNDQMSPLFQAAVEATEEAAINSLFAATSMDGAQGMLKGTCSEASIRRQFRPPFQCLSMVNKGNPPLRSSCTCSVHQTSIGRPSRRDSKPVVWST